MTGLFPKKTFVVSDGFHLQGCNRVLYDKKSTLEKVHPTDWFLRGTVKKLIMQSSLDLMVVGFRFFGIWGKLPNIDFPEKTRQYLYLSFKAKQKDFRIFLGYKGYLYFFETA